MTLPTNFDDFEHLQSVFTKVHNRQVREVFSDLGDDDWVPDISTARGSLRQACTIKDNDTASVIIMRFLMFYLSLGRIEEILEPYYGIPLDDHQQNVKFRPVISLYFKEDEDDVDPDYSPLRMQVSFRYPNETSSTITESNLRTIAKKIKTEFAAAGGYRFHKGKELYTYKEPEKGYNFQLYAYSETVARDLINKVLDIQSHALDSTKFISHLTENASGAFPTNPGTKFILGETRKNPRRRPVGWVRFKYAIAHVHGVFKPIPLVDLTYRWNNPLVDAF